ncbi:hypothetical protein BC936DRAFT_140145 [Jimgerdemannia flammicorona]|uniref:NADPH--hemoprotein reductase n=1 Tax=Jimgerdemannia flammicorona TaxID=994334 RepID=A0A433AZ30_9FUNG|nr:hypothetical protein BC936DRAFT_140145 [Jimgerdemannia flammicorona]
MPSSKSRKSTICPFRPCQRHQRALLRSQRPHFLRRLVFSPVTTVGIAKDIVNDKTRPGLSKEHSRVPHSEHLPPSPCPATQSRPSLRCQALGLKSTAKGGVSDAYLFFGCRHIDQDFIYRDELEVFVEDGTLPALHTAFSRHSNDPKRYVQHYIMANASHVWNLITEHKAIIYI